SGPALRSGVVPVRRRGRPVHGALAGHGGESRPPHGLSRKDTQRPIPAPGGPRPFTAPSLRVRPARCDATASPYLGRANMDEARSMWDGRGLILQATWPTVALLLVDITGFVVGARAAEQRPRPGRIRALRRPTHRRRSD